MKINGLKKAIGEYKRANSEGYYSPRYGKLMYDTSIGEIWTDWFYSLGHNEWKVYRDESVIDLGHKMGDRGINITMSNVKKFIAENL